MDYNTKYIKVKIYNLQSQIGGVDFPNIKGSDDTDKQQASFFDIKSLETVRLLNKDHAKRMEKPKDCIDSCKCEKLKPTGKILECEGVCIDYCKLNNDSIRIAVKEWLENKDKAIEKYGDISTWDTSNVTDMSALFYEKENFNEDISNWNVSNVKRMNNMFSGATDFNQPLNKWNVSNVKSMGGLFGRAKRFNKPLNNWNVSKVEYMSGMFFGAERFNQDISEWDVSNVEDMGGMFKFAKSFNQDISKWEVKKVDAMNNMFHGAVKFNQDISKWDVSKVKYMYNMFSYAHSMEEKNKPNFKIG